MSPITQEFLEIEDIKDGVVILKDRSLRGIAIVSSLNFALKSEDEQNAILYQFQNFLNSLDFSCQIIVHSRRINIVGQINKLKELEDKQTNELLRIQTKDYREFIEKLVGTGQIMTKSFYLIVPFFPIEISPKRRGTIWGEEEFKRYRIQLFQRMEFLILGLRRCGLSAIPLDSEELIELFWTFCHPKEAEVGYYPEIPPELIK